jgi:hypothetical protein
VNHNWTADRHAGDRRKHDPIWVWMPVFAALASMLAICTYRYIEVWTLLQQFYFKTYILTGLRSVVGMANSGHYELLAVTTKNGSHWASDGELTEARTAAGERTVALTQETLKNGGLHLVLVTVQSDDGNLHDFLRQGIYRDQSLAVFLRPALWGALAVLFVWPAFTLLKEVVRARERRHGRRSSVPELASSLAFHRTNPTHGIRRDLTDDKPAVAVPKKQPTFIEARLTDVKPDDPPKVVTTAASGGDDARRKIMQGEIKQEPEHKLSRRLARKERYFQ